MIDYKRKIQWEIRNEKKQEYKRLIENKEGTRDLDNLKVQS